MGKEAPAVSVIIPTYNRAPMLERAIGSVLRQTHSDLEILVVDDASTDATEDVVRRFADDPRIRYMRHDRNRGGSAARNTGIRAARAEFLAFLDSDDEWFPQKLARQMALFAEAGECGVVYSGLERVYRDGRVRRPAGLLPEGRILKQLLLSNVVGSTSSVVVRRRCLDAAGLFDEALPSCQDWDLWIRLARTCTFRRVAAPLVRHYWHDAQISTNRDAVYRGHEAILAKYGAEIRALGRRAEAVHHFRLGMYLYHGQQWPAARRHLFRAATCDPWRLRHTVYLVAALTGPRGYARWRSLKRALVGGTSG